MKQFYFPCTRPKPDEVEKAMLCDPLGFEVRDGCWARPWRDALVEDHGYQTYKFRE